MIRESPSSDGNDWTTIRHRSKNGKMEHGGKDLIAQLLLENRSGAYIVCQVNDFNMTPNKIFKDLLLVMLFCKQTKLQP